MEANKNYEFILAEKWWSELPIAEKKDILNKLSINTISDEFLSLVWRLTLWLTEADVNNKINDFIRHEEFMKQYYLKTI